jgi:NAD(P)-dependent dehydrogenase (short-subunit alcohol dehydrogenase family)
VGGEGFDEARGEGWHRGRRGTVARQTVGTGRAAAIVFAREGAKVLLVDRDIDSARETAKIITDEGGHAVLCRAGRCGGWCDEDF